MPKISWNDIDDEDSSLSSEGEQIQKYVPQKKMIYPLSKLKNACDQMSLRKLQNHQNNDVWLYIPNSFYERGEDVNAILDNNKQLKKVYRNKSIGWNVLTSKQTGRTLIEEGLEEENIFIKFIYSNKNQQRMGLVEQRAKLQKKVTYVQKINKTSQEQKKQEIKQEQSSKMQKKEQAQGDKGERKKLKYILKSKSTITDPNDSIINQSIKQTPMKTTLSIKSPSKILQKNNFKSPKKYKLKQQQGPQLQKDIHKQIRIQQVALPITISIKSQSMDTESQPIKDAQYNKEGDLSSDESIQKQQKKKKKKKNNKKNKGVKVQKVDQNPFSYFMK